jgi:UDP-N-acetylglucosamine acyltransferase
MGYVHIAHDCIIGNNCIFANAVTIAGHVEIDDYVIIGGMTPIHQFIKIGEYSMVAGASALAQDIPPYCMAEGNRAMLRGLNLTGLRRHFSDRKEINLINTVYKELFEKGNPLQEIATKIFNETDNEKVRKMCKFIINTKRGIPFKRKNNG